MKNILGMIMCIVVIGCTHITPNYAISIEGCTDKIAMNISKGLTGSYQGVSVLVSTPVDAVTYAPSDFGLALQEFLIGSLVRHGTNVVDVQLRKEPYITCEEGLVSLSRDATRLKGEFQAEVIIVSTYLAGERSVIITSRAVDATTNNVIASATTSLRMTDHIAGLLSPVQQSRMYER